MVQSSQKMNVNVAVHFISCATVSSKVLQADLLHATLHEALNTDSEFIQMSPN